MTTNNPLHDIHAFTAQNHRGHQLQYVAPTPSISPTNFQATSQQKVLSGSQRKTSPQRRVHNLKQTGNAQNVLRKSAPNAPTSDAAANNQPPALSAVRPLISEPRPFSVQSDSTVLYQEDQADVYHFTVEVDADTGAHLKQSTTGTFQYTAESASSPTAITDTTNAVTTTKKNKRVMKIHEKSSKGDAKMQRPSSADSIDRLMKPNRKNIQLPQDENQNLLSASANLKKRTPKYYRDLLAADRSTDVSYLLDAELKTLTVNQIMNHRKQSKKLPPLQNGNYYDTTANPLQERIKFPSVLEQVLKVIGKPTELDLPPTKIPQEFHVNEDSPIVTDQKKQSTFDPESGMWSTHVFPSKIPASRVEVVHLSKAFEQMILAVKETTKLNSIEELTALMDVLDAVGTEVVRQVHVHCSERGVLLKILLEVFQNTNKQALYFYQKARQMVYHKHNELKSLASKVSDLNNLVAQKNNEVSLFRNEVHELKLKLREQREQIKKLTKDRDLQATELQKVQEEHFRKIRAHAPKQASTMTSMTMQRIDLLEAKAMEALNEEHRRMQELKRQEEEELAAAQALKEAQEELRRAEEERRLLEEMRRKEEVEEKSDDEFLDIDKDNEKRIQTEEEDTTNIEVQTDPVKFKNKRNKKEKRKQLKYRNSPTRPKSPPRVTQPIMQPVVQPVALGEGSQDEIRKNKVESRGNDSSDDDTDNLRSTQEHTLQIPKRNALRQKSPRRSKGKIVSPHTHRSPKARSSDRLRSDRTSEVKLRTLSQDDLFELFHDLVVNNHGSRKYSLRWVNKNVLELLSDLTDSDFLASTTDMRNIRRFVYDYHLVKFGLATIAVQHLAEFLHNVKQYYRESSRVRTFIQFCVLAQWYKKEQQDIYTLSTLSLYLRALNFTKSILNKKALKELEEGTLYVSETFVFNLLDRLKLPLNEEEQQQFFNTVSQQSEEGYIYFDDLAILLIATYHKHEEGQTIMGDISDALDVPQLTAGGDESDPLSARISARSSGGTKTASVSVAAFKRVVRNFFGKLYVVGSDVNDPTFVKRNENITKRDLVQVYGQCQRLVVEIINSLENAEVRGKFLEVHSNLYRIVNEVDLEEAMTHYKNYICVLLRERHDENSQIFSRMISTLMR